MDKRWHEPVLVKEVIEFLNCKPGGIYVDATLGGGGWAEVILKASRPDGRLIGFDRDRDAIEEARRRLGGFLGRFEAVKATFSAISSELKKIGICSVNGVVADLGVSSHQLGESNRGFSFMRSARLDMRMDDSQDVTAYDIVNFAGVEGLGNLFFELGEERYSRRIARAIVREREKSPIETTEHLASIVSGAVPAAVRRGRIHPATRVFQALRIKVNDELNELKSLVETAPGLLEPGGRLIVVSYHSLEDRIVKQAFVGLSRGDEFKRVTKKPIKPAEGEILKNRRARSACLRVLERI